MLVQTCQMLHSRPGLTIADVLRNDTRVFSFRSCNLCGLLRDRGCLYWTGDAPAFTATALSSSNVPSFKTRSSMGPIKFSSRPSWYTSFKLESTMFVQFCRTSSSKFLFVHRSITLVVVRLNSSKEVAHPIADETLDNITLGASGYDKEVELERLVTCFVINLVVGIQELAVRLIWTIDTCNFHLPSNSILACTLHI